jgi:hypothetical protein
LKTRPHCTVSTGEVEESKIRVEQGEEEEEGRREEEEEES